MAIIGGVHLTPRASDTRLDRHDHVIVIGHDLGKVAHMAKENFKILRLAAAMLTPSISKTHNERAAVSARLIKEALDISLHRI